MESFLRNLIRYFGLISLGLTLLLRQGVCDSSQAGPHGGVVTTTDEDHKYEVKVDRENKKIMVYPLSKKATTDPHPVQIKLFSDNLDDGEPITLRAIDLGQGRNHYQGELDPTSSSYAGFELSFEIGPHLIKSVRINSSPELPQAETR